MDYDKYQIQRIVDSEAACGDKCRLQRGLQLQLLAVSDGRRREQSGPELMDTSRRCNKTGRSEPCGRLWQKSMRVRGDEHG